MTNSSGLSGIDALLGVTRRLASPVGCVLCPLEGMALDTATTGDDTVFVPGLARGVFLDDARGNGRRMRVSWHPEVGMFVVSHWDGDVCIAAVRLRPEDAAAVIGVLTDGLVAVAATPPTTALTDAV